MIYPANHWKLGLFVVACLMIALAAIAFVGAKQFDREVDVMYFFFDEPVDGLTIGSEVRLRGIPIGSVTAIGLAEDLVHVGVEAEVDVKTLIRLRLRSESMDNPHEHWRQGIVSSGLRSFLERNPLTGVSIINSDFFPQHRNQFPDYPFDVPERTIPTVPSVFKGIMADLEATLRWLRTELPGTLDLTQGLLRRLDTALSDLRTGELSTEAQETLRSLRVELEGLQLADLAGRAGVLGDELTRALVDTRTLVTTLSAGDGPLLGVLRTYRELGERLRAELDGLAIADASAALERALTAVSDAGTDVSELSAALHAELTTVQRTLHTIQRLADLLERDPGALLHGRDPGRPVLEGGRP